MQSYQPNILAYLPFIKGLCVTWGRVRVSKRKTRRFQRFTVVARCFNDIDKMSGGTQLQSPVSERKEEKQKNHLQPPLFKGRLVKRHKQHGTSPELAKAWKPVVVVRETAFLSADGSAKRNPILCTTLRTRLGKILRENPLFGTDGKWSKAKALRGSYGKPEAKY